MPSKVAIEKIQASQLRVGLYVSLNLGWMDHPFLFSSFKIKTPEQLAAVRRLGLSEIEYLPGRSDVPPLAVDALPADEPPAPGGADPLQELWQEKRQRMEMHQRYREELAQCEKRFVKTAGAVKSIMRNLFTHPREALVEAQGTVEDMLQAFLSEGNLVTHLMGDGLVDEATHMHGLNVSVLSLILGRDAGVDEDGMKELGLGALLHDIGKTRIPTQILQKPDKLTQAELNFLRLHPVYGEELARKLPSFPPRAMDIVRHHHENFDGKGYPDGLTGERIDRLTAIVAIANAYDNYCNPREVARAMTPAEALAHMFKADRNAFDPELLQRFIRCMGIYPPGTVVVLSSGTVGMVVALNTDNLLRPSVLLYDKHVPKQEAVVFDLRRDPEIKIVRSLRPKSLPPEIYDYLNPRTRICYFVDQEGRSHH